MALTTNPLQPTYNGFVNTSWDALLLFEGCLSGQMNHVPRRPHDRERQDLIRSGNVFIYEEHASGIKRWTDGISWSPSRILGNFLIYRELDEPFPPGEKKRALKKSKHTSGGLSRPETMTRTVCALPTPGVPVPYSDHDVFRKILVGSLVDSYNFKAGGLIKKTISVTVNGVPHHLVSYYSVDDVLQNHLMRPSMDKRFFGVGPRHELSRGQNFRASMEEFGNPEMQYYQQHAQFAAQAVQSGTPMPLQSQAYMPQYGQRAQPWSPQHMHNVQTQAMYNPVSTEHTMNGMASQQDAAMASQEYIRAQQAALTSTQQQAQAMTWNYGQGGQAPYSQYFNQDSHIVNGSSISNGSSIAGSSMINGSNMAPSASVPNGDSMAAGSQMSLTNGGYYEDQDEDSDDVKAEQMDEESWPMSQANHPSWPGQNAGHGPSGHHGHNSWNGQ